MEPARRPRGEPLDERVLHVDPARGTLTDLRVRELPDTLRAGDVLVLNDAATIPASLRVRTSAGETIELRLAGAIDDRRWSAVLFDAADWRTKTEDRAAPPTVREGETLFVGPDLHARVTSVSSVSPRLISIAFSCEGVDLWRGIYRHGRPIQYAYAARPFELWDVQNRFASRPWSVEPPSASHALTLPLIAAMRARGVIVATVTHAAGLSSTGDAVLDAALPLPERYDLPEDTVRAVVAAHARGSRIVAGGTTVVRALEGCAHSNGGALVAGVGTTELHIARGFRPTVIDGVFTGVHEPSTSHYDLLEAFAPADLIAQATRHAEATRYMIHEFGDAMLVLG